MKKSIKLVLITALAIIMVLPTVSCGNNSNPPSNSGEAAQETEAATNTQEPTATDDSSGNNQAEELSNVPIYLSDTSPITLDWYVDENWYTRAKWGEDLTSKYITEKTGVSLNIIIPQGDSSATKTVMIASGDLPDIMGMGQWLSEWKTMRDSDMLYSFQELSELYDPELFDVMSPSILAYWRHDDGLNYVYPNSAWGTEDLADAKYLMSAYMSVRKDIYEAIGEPDMTTPDGFINALSLAKEQFPEINGQPIIPLLIGREFNSEGNSSLDSGMMKWVLNLPSNERDFYTYDLNTDPEIERWLKTFNRAYNEGLISNDQFTDRDAQIQEKLTSGRVFATLYSANTVAQYNGLFYEEDPNSIYIPVEGMYNSKGEESFYSGGGLAGWHVNMITKNCKDPERAIKFFHYWLSEEGQEDFFYGDPSMWEIKDGKKWMKDDIYALRETDEAEFCSVYGGRDNYFMLIQPVYADDKFRQTINPWYQPYYDFSAGKIKNSLVRVAAESCEPDADTPEAVEYSNLMAKWGELLPQMIIAKDEAEFDSIMEQYKSVSEKSWAVVGPVMRDKFEKNLTKLGINQ